MYARVSSSDQKADVDRQVRRVTEWTVEQGLTVGKVVTEVGSALNGQRRKFLRLLGDPNVTTIVVEHRDRFARFGAEYVQAALNATGRRLLVVDPDEVDDDLVRDMTDMMTSMCARLYGRRGARNRAARALQSAQDTESVQDAESVSRRGVGSRCLNGMSLLRVGTCRRSRTG